MYPSINRTLALMAALVIAGAVPSNGQDLNQNEDFNKGGRTALQFLKIGVGARQAAMGEASIAVVRDVNALFWNPANISGIEKAEASFSYTAWLADMNYVAGAVGARWNGVGVFALSIAALDYGDIPEAVTIGGGSAGDARTGNTFSGNDMLVGLSYSREFTDRLSIGVGAKYVRESLWDFSVGTYAFDVGTSYYIGYRGTRLSMSAQNFGGSVKWLADEQTDRIEGYDLPLVFRIGLSTNLMGGEDAFFNGGDMHRVVFSAEAINSNDYNERLNLGAEYWFGNLFAVRGGYRINYADGNWTAGVGLMPEFSGMQVRLDYAYVAYEFLDAPHRFTLSLAF